VADPADLSDDDRVEAIRLAHYVVESVRDNLVFPIANVDSDARGEILRLSQYLLELADPSQNRSLTVDAKFDSEEGA
jgi:hypothetical protein